MWLKWSVNVIKNEPQAREQAPPWPCQPITFRPILVERDATSFGVLHRWLVAPAVQSQAAFYSKVVNPQQ